MIKLLKRCTETAVKIPVAVAWDVVSLCNLTSGSSTCKVMREHNAKKQMDEAIELFEKIKELEKLLSR